MVGVGLIEQVGEYIGYCVSTKQNIPGCAAVDSCIRGGSVCTCWNWFHDKPGFVECRRGWGDVSTATWSRGLGSAGYKFVRLVEGIYKDLFERY
jgi:hypothetical protein